MRREGFELGGMNGLSFVEVLELFVLFKYMYDVLVAMAPLEGSEFMGFLERS